MVLNPRWLQVLTIFTTWCLLYWGNSSDFTPGLGAMIHGVLAKHILTSGEWLNLHYIPEIHPDYYQQPPLVIWLASIAFKIFGINDYSSKIVPAFSALGCVGVLFAWGETKRNRWFGFCASMILLSTFRFVQVSEDLRFGPTQAFFIVWGAFLFIQSLERPKFAPIAAGICFTLAFLSKGVPAFVLPVITLFYSLSQPYQRSRWIKHWITFAISAGLSTLIWLYGMDGTNYLSHYYHSLQETQFVHDKQSGHLAPIKDILISYWPWLPAAVYAIWKIFVKRGSKFMDRFSTDLGMAAFASVVIIGAYTTLGYFMKHYLTPVYPFLALLAAEPIASFTDKRKDKWVENIFWMVFACTLIVALFPSGFINSSAADPTRDLLKRTSRECLSTGATQISIQRGFDEDPRALALGNWYTNWKVALVDDQAVIANTPDQLYVAHDRDLSELGWERTTIKEGDFRVFKRPGSMVCPSRPK